MNIVIYSYLFVGMAFFSTNDNELLILCNDFFGDLHHIFVCIISNVANFAVYLASNILFDLYESCSGLSTQNIIQFKDNVVVERVGMPLASLTTKKFGKQNCDITKDIRAVSILFLTRPRALELLRLLTTRLPPVGVTLGWWHLLPNP